MATGIDIGSNSLRAVKIDCAMHEKVAEYEKVVRTAEGLDATGRISDGAIERIIEALKEAQECMGGFGRVRAVATAAFRMAKNAQEATECIESATGIPIEIVDAETESLLSVRGVEYGLRAKKYPTERFLMADIGGASTEIVMKHRADILFRSFRLGILTTIERFRTKEEIVFGIRRHMSDIEEFLRDLFELFGKPKIFVGTGGTPATVAALKLGLTYETYDAAKVSGVTISSDDIEKAYTQLMKLPPKERARLVGTGREDAIMAGLVILGELLRRAGYKEMVVSDEGVREGAALSLCGS